MNNRNAFFAEVFTRELNRWKQEHHRSQEQFAGVLEIEPNMITRYKQGKAYPTDVTLEKICRVLNVDRSIFFPQTFDERLKYDKAFHDKIQMLVQEMELEYVLDAGIDFFFWSFLWSAIPNLKKLLPSSVHEIKEGFLFQKKVADTIELFDSSDLEFIANLQKDVVNYVYMQAIKYALGQQLDKFKSQAVHGKCLPDEKELNKHLDNVFNMILQDLLRNPGKEDFSGID